VLKGCCKAESPEPRNGARSYVTEDEGSERWAAAYRAKANVHEMVVVEFQAELQEVRSTVHSGTHVCATCHHRRDDVLPLSCCVWEDNRGPTDNCSFQKISVIIISHAAARRTSHLMFQHTQTVESSQVWNGFRLENMYERCSCYLSTTIQSCEL
jgi:hypothetical protein